MEAYKLGITGFNFPMQIELEQKTLRRLKRPVDSAKTEIITADLSRALTEAEDKLDQLQSTQDRCFIREKYRLRAQIVFLKCTFNKTIKHSETVVYSTGNTKSKEDNPPSHVNMSQSILQYLPHRDMIEKSTKLYAPTWVKQNHTSSQCTKHSLNVNLDTCPSCNKNMKVCNTKGIMVCDNCGRCKPYMDITVNALPYKNNVDVSSFTYKRINHFNDWLLQVQGKEGFCVAEEDINKVKNLLLNSRIALETVTVQKVREHLKILKLNNLYDHVTQITCKLTGCPSPSLSPQDEERCRLMFISIQEPFELHCPPERKNFLSYPYCLYKFLELLNCTDVLKSFILLKGRDKLQRQDETFKNICETLKWKFIPSV